MIGLIASLVSGGLFQTVENIFKDFTAQKISEAEAKSRVEVALNETLAKATESVQATVRSSSVIQRAYAVALVSQVIVLVWYQLGAPAYLVLTGTPWPSAGATVEWAYLLVGGLAGVNIFMNRKN